MVVPPALRKCFKKTDPTPAALTHSAVGDSHSGRDAAATKQSSNASSGSTSEHRGAPAAAYVTINARKTPRARRIDKSRTKKLLEKFCLRIFEALGSSTARCSRR